MRAYSQTISEMEEGKKKKQKNNPTFFLEAICKSGTVIAPQQRAASNRHIAAFYGWEFSLTFSNYKKNIGGGAIRCQNISPRVLKGEGHLVPKDPLTPQAL